jgi:hypothetical protein
MDIHTALIKALHYSGGERSLQDCLDAIAKKQLIPLYIKEQFIFVEVYAYPQKSALNISYVAGNGYLHHLDSIIPILTDLAKALDCSEITCYGRRGWEKALSKYGAKVRYTVLALEV